MGEGPGTALRRARRSNARANRAWLITTAVGATLLVVSAIVFAVAHGTQGLTTHAESVHIADETLRVATVARAQVAMANHFASIQRELAVDVEQEIITSSAQANDALDLVAKGAAQLRDSGGEISSGLSQALTDFDSLSREVLDLIASDRSEEASVVVAEQLDAPYATAFTLLQEERDRQLDAVARSDESMARMGDVAQILLALLIPGGMIIIYRELALRMHRQAELKLRLDAERAVSKVREDFVANASHELRTPLTIIYGMAQVIESDPDASVVIRDLASTITKESEDLHRMVEDLLTTSQLDADAIKYVVEDVWTSEEVEAVVVPLVARDGGHVETSVEDAQVRVDRTRQRQVLRNLVSNALKHGGPQIRLTGRVVADMYEWVVADNGEGVSKEVEARLFQRFVHRGSLMTSPGGVGIGLSIVRALVEGMAGTIEYTRRDGWTEFHVAVPVAQPASALPADDSGNVVDFVTQAHPAPSIIEEGVRVV